MTFKFVGGVLIGSLWIASVVFAGLSVRNLAGRQNRQDVIRTVSALDLLPQTKRIFGGSNSDLSLVEFGDYECPPCRASQATIAGLERSEGGKLAIYFWNFPLTTIHPHARDAATLSLQASAAGKLPAIHHEMMKGFVDGEGLAELRKEHQLSTNDGDRRRALEDLARDLNMANRLGVRSTPSFFLVVRNEKVIRLDHLPQSYRELAELANLR